MGAADRLSIPMSVLALGRYAAAPMVAGSARPVGSGLTGADIGLLWTILDRAETSTAGGIVSLPQTTISARAGKVHPTRIGAAFDRLCGTDMLIDNGVMPAIKSWSHRGEGRDRRYWDIELDRRLIDLVRAAFVAGERIPVDAESLRAMSSRLSAVLYGRWLAWLGGGEHIDGVIVRQYRQLQTLKVHVPMEAVAPMLGLAGGMKRSLVDRLVLTASDRSPLRGEFARAGIALDVHILKREGFGDAWGLQMEMSALRVDGGLSALVAGQRHDGLRQDQARARWRASQGEKASVSTPNDKV